MATDQSSVFFQKVSPFPAIVDGQINTQELLSACESIVKFVEILGLAFKPVRDDISGNIVKLRAATEKDPQRFQTLNALLEEENERLKASGKFMIATDALLWLTRALSYMQLFLKQFFEDFQQCQNDQELSQLPESLAPIFEKAYDASLKRHHGWMVQKIFGLCLRAVPYRASLLGTLGYLKEDQKVDMTVREVIVGTMSDYILMLCQCVDALVELLQKHDQSV